MPTDLPGVLIFFGKAFIIQNVGENKRKQIFDKAKKSVHGTVSALYGGERISTGKPSFDKRAEARHLYKSFKL